MEIFFEGVLKYGLVLAIMTGPIFFALLQVSVEEGFAAGMVVGLGVWISYLLFIAGVTWGMSYAMNVSEGSDMTFFIGILGGIILMVFGFGTMLSKPPKLVYESNKTKRHSSWFSLWTKGFLINTVNPFTFFFWIGIASTAVVKKELSIGETTLFFAGIMGTVIVTDFIKVYLSKEIRQFLKVKHLIWLRYISGGALIVFGIVLMVRVLLL